MKQRIYISGPMTGLPQLNFPAFNRAAEQLRAIGMQPVNPADLNPNPAATWHDCMRVDIKALCDCDALAMLPGWEASAGAHLEVQIAHRLGMALGPLDRWLGGAQTVTLAQVLALRDRCLPNQGEDFDWLTFARACRSGGVV